MGALVTWSVVVCASISFVQDNYGAGVHVIVSMFDWLGDAMDGVEWIDKVERISRGILELQGIRGGLQGVLVRRDGC